jgi:adenine-specific DNA-methyltransferase
VLNYTHRGKIDAIYIDPPYNTGARDWRYNNDYVDAEDPYRHSKWISFMEHRLRLARNLLSETGIICVTIDDHEFPRLEILMGEIFGEANRLGVAVIRNNPQGRSTIKGFSVNHEYALFYGKTDSAELGRLPRTPKQLARYPETDELGNQFLWENFRKTGSDSLRNNRPKQFYPIYVSKSGYRLPQMEWGDKTKSWKINDRPAKDEEAILPIDSSGTERVWKWGYERVIENPNHIKIQRDKNGKVEIYRRNYPSEGSLPRTLWDDAKYAAGSHGTNLLTRMFGKSHIFDFPKSVYAVEDCIKVCGPQKDALVLDFFAGSGTTGHAVLELNRKDGGNRRFILCTNNENKIAQEVTYPRVKNVIEGYADVEGIPANLRYYKTEFVDVESVHNVPDQKKIELTYKTGWMIALREDTLEEVEKSDWWQIFTDKKGKTTAIYFKEDKERLDDLLGKISKADRAALYIFSWGKNEYKNEFTEYKNIRVEDIPEPILEVYKEINKK